MWDTAVHHLAWYAGVLAKLGLLAEGSYPQVIDDAQLIEMRFREDAEESWTQRVSGPGLLVLRLGVTMTKNVELPNAVWEVSRIRETRKLPIALVNEPYTPWTKSHRAYSPELDRYLTDRFHRVEVK